MIASEVPPDASVEKPLLTCSCPGFTYRLDCRHVALIEGLLAKGEPFPLPFEIQSSRDPRRMYRIEAAPEGGRP